MQRATHQRANKAPRVADEAAKWLDWPDYLRLVETLKRECAPLTHQGAPRSEKDVATAVQRYLLFAILACVPDRQRTLRELQLNRTLFCEEYEEAIDDDDGVGAEDEEHVDEEDEEVEVGVRWVRRRRWVVRHSPDDYKTGNAYGARPALVLDQRLYPALESWLFGHVWDETGGGDGGSSGGGGGDGGGREGGSRGSGVYVFNPSGGYAPRGHRAALSPSHALVFSRPNGEPWSVSELSRTFSRTAMRLTGKKTNPHLIRDMIITHVRREGLATDAELEALSLYMGHSMAMQKGTYDRRTQQQKVAPAIGEGFERRRVLLFFLSFSFVFFFGGEGGYVCCARIIHTSTLYQVPGS